MKDKRAIYGILVILAGWVLPAGCAGGAASSSGPGPAAAGGGTEPVTEVGSDEESSGLVDLDAARKLLAADKYEDLLDTFEPKTVPQLTARERAVLADLFHQASVNLRDKFKNVSFSSLMCERGLMLAPRHQPLLRQQIENYLHPDMKLFGGAEELAAVLVEIDPESAENQLLRGKIAFEQGEYGDAVMWLKKAARSGRQHRGRVIEEAWQLLDLARGKQQEIKSALSMTRELEVMLKRARKLSAETGPAGEPKAAPQPAALAGGTITLYMTRWCGYCRKARALLEGMKVAFEQKDIEHDQDALMEMMRFAEDKGVEVTGVPVLRIGNQLVVGYNPQRIENLVDKIR